jgi:hypothetical protein
MMDGGTMFDNIEKQRATARVAPTAVWAVLTLILTF